MKMKMRKRRKWFMMLLCTLLIFSMVACGGRTEPSHDVESKAEMVSVAAETEAETVPVVTEIEAETVPVIAETEAETVPVAAETETETPEAPETPEVQETPEAPETLETPETPVAPETSEAPETPETPAMPEMPEAMDYSLQDNWAYFEIDQEKPVDVFLICPTVDTKSETNSFDLNDKLKGRFVNALDMEKGIYEETGRMFSPYYRQMSIGVYSLPEEIYEAAKAIAYRDISDAFRWYLENVNDGRGFVLAGFSQGSEMAIELLKEYFGGDGEEAAALRDQLITVYAIGWRVTDEMRNEYLQIVPASGEDDLGTVVCFDCENGELTGTVIIPEGTKSYSINPLNWKTDQTPADKSLNKGAVMATGAEPIPELCGAVIGERGELIVTDVKAEDYPPVLDIFPEGAYHLYDYMFYFTNLKENLALRADAWLKAHPAESETEPAETEPAETEPAETEPMETEPMPAEQPGETESEIDRILAGMTLEEKVGQMIMADFRNWVQDGETVPVTSLNEAIRNAIARNRFGGIILFAENCAQTDQTLALVREIQAANLSADREINIPLLIAADQEGGIVARLGEGTRWTGNMALAATGDPVNAEQTALRIGQELSAVGINTDFAPVLDVNNNPANPVIGVRSFSDDPATVAKYGVAYQTGLQKSGTIGSLKHFPGHGDVATDSHFGFPVLYKTYEELKECELVPFKAAIEAGAEMIMTAHIQYPEIEKGTYTSTSTGEEVFLPATLSHTILTDILRGDMGFDGVIISDALNMAAIKENFDRQDVAVMAISAGMDMFLMPVPVTDLASLKELEDFMAYIVSRVQDGTIAEERIDESVRRILVLKEKHGLLRPVAENELQEVTVEETAAEANVPEAAPSEESAAEANTPEDNDAKTPLPADQIVGSEENHAFEWELMQKAVTLVKNEGDVLPLQVKAGEKVLFLYSHANRMLTAEFARLRLVEEGLLPENVSFEAMSFAQDNKEACIQAVREANYVIGVTLTFDESALIRDEASPTRFMALDEVIQAVHAEEKPFILISAYLPYDVARFPEADAILASYGAVAMTVLPEGKATYSVNLPAAICGIFGEYEFAGTLPVNIPMLDENGRFTTENLYERKVQ